MKGYNAVNQFLSLFIYIPTSILYHVHKNKHKRFNFGCLICSQYICSCLATKTFVSEQRPYKCSITVLNFWIMIFYVTK